ncbi:DNA-binding transcriptional regulator, MerR family [Actinacidiphila yanglinensis]|uniref:DNA-binding transcriptional regulator, MerR family n=1 Tax=Actinacidiphila yanglinensis TaxID=310779 RepID=A0A1H6D530_9ACTN|nr:MerR family transcriptional regulator [Actinacidiphila yanglinensis]SEG80489.1 DNA-binding transcriptional regulator, MerR family [Actinacidiphila yanglinensis]
MHAGQIAVPSHPGTAEPGRTAEARAAAAARRPRHRAAAPTAPDPAAPTVPEGTGTGSAVSPRPAEAPGAAAARRDDTAALRIGDAAAAAGTTPRALRFYEQRGLLAAPERTASGQRRYSPADIARVRLIRDLLAAGFTVADLRGLAPRLQRLVDAPAPRCVPEPGGVVARRLAALDAEIDRLVLLRERLTRRLAGDAGAADADA